MNNQSPSVPTEEVVDLSPFKRMVMTIGTLPTAFVESMTYYEALAYFANLLEKEIIPAVNQNAEATKELQALFVELKEYVDNYFTDLNIQTEINNKLDDMAESGQLVEIIGAYLDTQAITGFDTIADMAAGDNFINGSICRVLGKTNAYTGDGNLYRIRTKVEGDTPDGDNLVALTNFDSLIAQKVPDKELNDLSTTVTSINNSVTDIEMQLNGKETIFLNDSYGEGYTNDGMIPLNQRFWKIFADLNGITTYHEFHHGGIGFYQEADSLNFLKLLKANEAGITKENIRYICVFAGYNDSYQNPTADQISASVSEFVTYVKNNYPNAEVVISNVGYDCRESNTGADRRVGSLKVESGYAYSSNSDNNYIFLPNGYLALHSKYYFATDGYHPNALGHKSIAMALNNAFHKSYSGTQTNPVQYCTLTHTYGGTGSTGEIMFISSQNTIHVRPQNIVLQNASDFTLGHSWVNIASYDTRLAIPSYGIKIQGLLTGRDSSNHYEIIPIEAQFNNNQTLSIRGYKLNSTGDNWASFTMEYAEIALPEFEITKAMM